MSSHGHLSMCVLPSISLHSHPFACKGYITLCVVQSFCFSFCPLGQPQHRALPPAGLFQWALPAACPLCPHPPLLPPDSKGNLVLVLLAVRGHVLLPLPPGPGGCGLHLKRGSSPAGHPAWSGAEVGAGCLGQLCASLALGLAECAPQAVLALDHGCSCPLL